MIIFWYRNIDYLKYVASLQKLMFYEYAVSYAFTYSCDTSLSFQIYDYEIVMLFVSQLWLHNVYI